MARAMRSPAARRAADSVGAQPAQLGQQLGLSSASSSAMRSSAWRDRLQLDRRPLGVGQHLFDRVAVLALQAVDQVQALFDLLQASRVELDRVAVALELARQVVQQRGRPRPSCSPRRRRVRIDARQPRQRLLGQARAGPARPAARRRSAGQQLHGLAAQGGQLLGVGQAAPLRLQLVVFARARGVRRRISSTW